MIDILDLCSGKWEREEMGGDYEWEVVCTGWSPNSPQRGMEQRLLLAQQMAGQAAAMMPADILDLDLDEYLTRMQRH